jgi:hypothetical protein
MLLHSVQPTTFSRYLSSRSIRSVSSSTASQGLIYPQLVCLTKGHLSRSWEVWSLEKVRPYVGYDKCSSPVDESRRRGSHRIFLMLIPKVVMAVSHPMGRALLTQGLPCIELGLPQSWGCFMGRLPVAVLNVDLMCW